MLVGARVIVQSATSSGQPSRLMTGQRYCGPMIAFFAEGIAKFGKANIDVITVAIIGFAGGIIKEFFMKKLPVKTVQLIEI